jgi:hypothetical protein
MDYSIRVSVATRDVIGCYDHSDFHESEINEFYVNHKICKKLYVLIDNNFHIGDECRWMLNSANYLVDKKTTHMVNINFSYPVIDDFIARVKRDSIETDESSIDFDRYYRDAKVIFEEFDKLKL